MKIINITTIATSYRCPCIAPYNCPCINNSLCYT